MSLHAVGIDPSLSAPAPADVLLPLRKHQCPAGRKRWANVYLPSGYDGKRTYPLWTHLHGVFWQTMAGIGQQVGRRVDGSEIIPV